MQVFIFIDCIYDMKKTITKTNLLSLITETIDEALTDLGYHPKPVDKGYDTFMANQRAQAEFDKLDKNKIAKSADNNSQSYAIDHEKRMKNLLIRRDAKKKEIAAIDVKLATLNKKYMASKSNPSMQLQILPAIQALMENKKKIMDEIVEISDAVVDSWKELSKKYPNMYSTKS